MKKTSGALVQDCDVYIGRRVQNGAWDLRKSIWSNPHFPKGGTEADYVEVCRLYEESLRSNLELCAKICPTFEGKLMGCWCKPEDMKMCHGEIIQKMLEEQQEHRIGEQLVTAGMEILRKSDLGGIRRARHWSRIPVWLANATRIDATNIFMYTREYYDQMRHQTGFAPEAFPVITKEKQVYLILGEFTGTQPLQPIWPDRFKKPIKPRGSALAVFAKLLQSHMDKEGPEKYVEALERAEDYLSLHRHIARNSGDALGIDMESHDLSKTRLVNWALAYLWHWEGNADDKSNLLTQAAQTAVKEGHCEREDHHPEFEAAGNGELDHFKMFADRISVHLQKDPKDTKGGWGVDPAFIPLAWRAEFVAFQRGFGHIDMYEQALKTGLADKMWPEEYNYHDNAKLVSYRAPRPDAKSL